jgi:hypothetical protein
MPALRYFPGAMCPHGRHTARQFFKPLIAYEIKILLSRPTRGLTSFGKTPFLDSSSTTRCERKRHPSLVQEGWRSNIQNIQR